MQRDVQRPDVNAQLQRVGGRHAHQRAAEQRGLNLAPLLLHAQQIFHDRAEKSLLPMWDMDGCRSGLMTHTLPSACAAP